MEQGLQQKGDCETRRPAFRRRLEQKGLVPGPLQFAFAGSQVMLLSSQPHHLRPWKQDGALDFHYLTHLSGWPPGSRPPARRPGPAQRVAGAARPAQQPPWRRLLGGEGIRGGRVLDWRIASPAQTFRGSAHQLHRYHLAPRFPNLMRSPKGVAWRS